MASAVNSFTGAGEALAVPPILGERNAFFAEHLHTLDTWLRPEHLNNTHCKLPGGLNRSELLDPNDTPAHHVESGQSPEEKYPWNSSQRIQQSRAAFHATIDSAILATEVRHGMSLQEVERLTRIANGSRGNERKEAIQALFPVTREVIRLLLESGYTYYDAAQ